jgi:ATP-dependent Lon protease
LVTGLVSSLTRRKVKRDVAMTGEVTLRGRVLPIGGLKEKVMAAHRGELKSLIIPHENEKDLKDIPERILKTFDIVLVKKVEEVLNAALLIDPEDPLFKDDETGKANSETGVLIPAASHETLVDPSIDALGQSKMSEIDFN